MSQNSGPAGWPRVERYFTGSPDEAKAHILKPRAESRKAGAGRSLPGTHAALPQQFLPGPRVAGHGSVEAAPQAVGRVIAQHAVGVGHDRLAPSTTEPRQRVQRLGELAAHALDL